MNKNPFTSKEEKVANALTEAYNNFIKLKTTHPSHEKEFIDGIHQCQNVMIHRIVQKDYPKIFPTYKKEKNEIINHHI